MSTALARPFIFTLERALGDRIRADDEMAAAVWCALSNVTWTHEDGREYGVSFRVAGDVITDIRGDGNYLDWYCVGNPGVIREDIAQAMREEGWKGTPL